MGHSPENHLRGYHYPAHLENHHPGYHYPDHPGYHYPDHPVHC